MLDPLFVSMAWLLDLFYRWQPSFGLAISLLTLAVYVAALPLTARAMRSMAAMAKIQPELDDVRRRHPDDRQ